MNLKVLLRSVNMNGDGETSNVYIEVFNMQTRLSLPLTFTVKERTSLDKAVQLAVAQLQEFARDFYSLVSQENPLG